MKRFRVILFWLIGISFITIGFLKFINLDVDEMSKSIFERANYPSWFFYMVATVEFAGGILLLMTAATSKRIGTILIGIVMLGAIGTRYLVNDNYKHFIIPVIIFLLSVLMSLDFERKEK